MDMGNQVGLRLGGRPTKRLASLLLVALFQTTCLTLPAAYAQSEASRSELSKQVAFNIPAGSLSAALLQVGQQAGIRLSVNAQNIKGINVSGFKELMTAQGALDVLLDGTGLVYEIDPSGIIIISSLQNTVSAGDGDPSLLPVIVTASSGDAAGWQGAPEWVYETPRAISVVGRDEIKNSNARGAADLFVGVPGVNVADNPQDPGISINIRGLQDQNRVNVMIDGARQNFQKAGHDEVGRFYIDPTFVKQVEIEKSAISGVGGAGAMGGVVNFRTIEASDLIKSGKSYGIEGKLAAGTNAYNFSGNLAAGVKLTENISFAAGISKKNLGKYDSGSNGSLTYSSAGQPIVFTGSETLSWLSKLNLSLGDDHEVVLGALGFHDAFTNSTIGGDFQNDSDISNITGTATYTWQPDDNWFDLEAKVWANRTQNDQYRLPRTAGAGGFDNDHALNTFGGSLQNTSEFDLSKLTISWNYGVEAFRDVGKSTTVPDNPADDPNGLWIGADPSGERSVFSAFNQFALSYNDLIKLDIGLRYDQFHLKGSSRALEYDLTGVPSVVDQSISNSGNRFSPTFGLSISPIENLQFFGRYSEGYRVPTVMETFLGGEHTGGGLPYLPNGSLNAELAKTWEGGANIQLDDQFIENDRLRLKLSYFNREVENYIALASVAGVTFDLGGFQYQIPYYQYANLYEPLKTQGFELEALYDAGRFFAGIAFNRSYIDLPDTFSFDNPYTMFGDAKDRVILLNVAPKTKLSANAGLRFWDERLTLGGRVTHVEPDGQFGFFASGYETDDYTIVDLYGSYEFNENATLRVDVNNLGDIAYVDALTAGGFPSPGLTITAALNFTF
ncbi:TonB-dependent receptor [Pseudovibrio sp. SCP19]|uniref:TonB-dependent receptor n=1 Tax=Pseudovibrio sp. SCP19 TaxID=3141374 RepID=UPI0033352235